MIFISKPMSKIFLESMRVFAMMLVSKLNSNAGLFVGSSAGHVVLSLWVCINELFPSSMTLRVGLLTAKFTALFTVQVRDAWEEVSPPR